MEENKKELTTVQQLRLLTKQDSGIFKEFQRIMKERTPQFLSSVISAVKRSDKLQLCDPNEILSCAMQSASIGLDVNPNLGFAAIVPYTNFYEVTDEKTGKTKKIFYQSPQYQIMWKGLVQLALRSGQYTKLNVDIIFNDEFKGKNLITGDIDILPVENGLRNKYIDATDYNDAKKQGVAGIIFYFELINGYKKVEYWSIDDCYRHAKRYSKSYQYDVNGNKKSSVWSTNFLAMAKKTVVKNTLSKYGPLSIDMQNAITLDQKVYNPETGEMEYLDNDTVIVESNPKVSGSDALRNALNSKKIEKEENTYSNSENALDTKETANASESESIEVIDNDKIPF